MLKLLFMCGPGSYSSEQNFIFSFHTRITTQIFSYFTGITHAMKLPSCECHHQQNIIFITLPVSPVQAANKSTALWGSLGLGGTGASLEIRGEKEMLFIW